MPHHQTPAPCLLALNTAEGLLQILVARKGAPPKKENTCTNGNSPPAFTLLTAQSWYAPSQGAELLAPVLHDTFARLQILPEHLTAIVCVRGPGSFTGLRLAAATSAGLARSTGALQGGIAYLPLLASSALYRFAPPLPLDKMTHLWVVTHARKSLVYMQGFTLKQGNEAATANPARHAWLPEAFTDILVCSPAEGAALAASHAGSQKTPARPVFLGSGLSCNRTDFTKAFSDCALALHPLFLPQEYDSPVPAALLVAAATCAWVKEDTAPLYVRPSDAEDNLERIARSLGIDPVAARTRLHVLTSS